MLNSSSLISGLALGLLLVVPVDVAQAQNAIPTLAGGSGGTNNIPASTGAGADGTQLGYTGGTGGSAGSTGGDGGNGAPSNGNIAPDSGGAGGSVPGAAGGAGQTFLVGGSGGGGGAHGYVGAALPVGGTLAGGAGGVGGGGGDTTPGNHNSGAAGGGGGGGFAAVVEGNGALGALDAALAGGTGGAGGDASIYGYAYGGKGGTGGGGLYLLSTDDTSLTITGTVQGGNGGNGGDGSSFGKGGSGAGGSAIYGVNSGGITTLTLADTARALGGNAGTVVTGGVAEAGGAGIAGENLNIILTAGSMVSAGATSDTALSRYAIQFTGGTNSLELRGNGGTSGQTYAAIDGDVLGSGDTTLKLTGAGGTLDLGLLDPTQGFSNFTGVTVNSAGSWIVAGTAVDPAPWIVAAGTLSNSLTGAEGATLAGDTSIVGGAHLSAHAVPNASAFTIGGNLSLLSSTSVLDVTLGAATSTPLIAVNGDLTLNGTLNIFDSGSMTPGSYTLFGYTGNYLGSGLTIGTTPNADNRYVISTATTNLVTLAVSVNGLYWNGTTTSGTGTVVGGGGTWTASSGTTNWIDPSNTYYVASNIGIPALFSATAGTVSIDRTDGAVSAQGLTFTTSGYTLKGTAAGDTLALAITSGYVPRVKVVGDSTVATIALPLTGTQGLEKTGTGKLILTGANTFTGGTTLTGGTLQLGDGTTTGSVVGNITNNATLVFNPAGLNASYAGVISGSGTVEKAGAGWQTLSGNNSYSGTTMVNGGLLLMSGNTALGSATGGTVVSSDATLGLFGTGLSVAEPLTLSGFGAGNLGALASFRGNSVGAGTNTVSGAITLAADASIVNSGGVGDVLNLTGTITGDGKSLYLGSSSTATNTVSGQINTGSGAVGIVSGSWALTNNNTYSGITVIGAGATLSLGNGGKSGSIAGTVLNSGTMVFNRSNTLTYSGIISGSGVLEKAGGGWLILSGANTYTGETHVTGGAIFVTNSSSLGKSSRVTVTGGAIALNTNGVTLSNPLTLSGMGIWDPYFHGGGYYFAPLTVRCRFCEDKVTISGPITLAGDTRITVASDSLSSGFWGSANATTQAVFSGGITGVGKNLTLSASIGTGSASEIYDGRSYSTISGVIATGTGSVTVEAGTWVFTAANTYTGMTTVQSAKLIVDGSLAGGATVNSGGILAGTGTIKGAVFKNGSMLAPGHSPGTLTVDGALSMESGSTYQVDVTPAGEHDLLIVNGNVTIANGASVEVIAQPGTYPASTTHTILTTSGTITGEFSSVTSDYAFLTPSLSYTGQTIALTLLDNQTPFVSYAVTPNQFAIATGAQALGAGKPVFDAIRQLAAGAVAPTLDQLSGEIYSSARTALVEDSRFVRNAVWDHLRASAGEDGGSAWSQAIGSWGHTKGNSNAARLDRSAGGLLMGLDAAAGEHVRLGAVWGFGQTNIDVNARGSSGKIDSFHFGTYAGGQWGAAAIRTGIAYSSQTIHMTRHILFPGFSDTTRAGYTGNTLQAFGEAAYGVDLGAAEVEPFASLAYVRARTDAFTETGGEAKLSGTKNATDVMFGTLGFRAATRFDLGKAQATLKVGTGWRHAFGDTTPITAMRYQAGGSAFEIAGLPVTRNAAMLDAGLNVAVSGQTSIGISYSGQLGNRIADHTAKASVSFLF